MSLNLRAPCIDQLHLHVGREIVAQLRVSKIYRTPNDDGSVTTTYELDDASGFILGRERGDRVDLASHDAYPFDADVQGRIRQVGDGLEWEIRRVTPLAPTDIRCASALLRRRRCPDPARAALLTLVKLENALQGALRDFMRALIQDPAVGERLLSCRASAKHHHAFAGGLLVHSTDLLDRAKALADQLLPDEPQAATLIQLGYLLHDLGKLRSVGAQTRPWPDSVVRHEVSTLMMLEPHLAKLRRTDPDAAAVLLYILDYVATPRESRRHAEFLGAEIVVFLDQLSVAAARDRSMAALLRKRPAPSGTHSTVSNDPLYHPEVRYAQGS